MTDKLEIIPTPGLPEDSGDSATKWGTAKPDSAVNLFLQGPQTRSFELGQAIRIFFESIRGFRASHFVG